MSVLDRSLGRPFGLLIGLVLVVVACSGASSAPPAASPLAASPIAASPGASVGASSAAPSARETALTDATLKVTAREFSFLQKSLEVKAGEPFTIVFKNADGPGVIHDVDIREKDGKTVVVDQETIDGGQTSDYEYPKLEAGEYVFICSIHPISFMTGKLTVN